MHIDYDSFFASVEQQANPFLRGKPIAITGSNARKGICTTASIQAKKHGVKTGMPFFKAEKLCPGLIPIRGDGAKYQYIHEKSLEIFNKYTDLVEPFSIDEAFLDITQTHKFFGTPQDVAHLIKQDILKAFGRFITCSIGIGPNKLMAKLVSDFNKPNGLFVVDTRNMEDVLQRVKLQDFCGIGPRINNRLEKLNITTTKDLQKKDMSILIKEFGNVGAQFLKGLSYGIDQGQVQHTWTHKAPKSIGHQHTLAKNTKNPKIIEANLNKLTQMTIKRLRNNNMLTQEVVVWLRDSQRKSYAVKENIYIPTDSYTLIQKKVIQTYRHMGWKEETRLVGVTLTKLKQKNNVPIPLFLEDEKEQKISKTIDDLNNKLGRFAISTAATIKADEQKNRVSSFLKHK